MSQCGPHLGRTKQMRDAKFNDTMAWQEHHHASVSSLFFHPMLQSSKSTVRASKFELRISSAATAAVLSLACVQAAQGAPDVAKLPPVAAVTADFARDIKPIFADHCVKCHGAEKQKGGLRLDNKASAFQGGDEGKVLVVGKSAESPLVHLVAGLEEDKVMPPKGERLTATQIGLLRAWIDQGAAWPDDGAPVAAVRTDHWSLQPLKAPAVPENATDAVDAFIRTSLAKDGLKLSPEADRATLIRRVSFDLIGLPPSPEEVDAFVNDAAPGAYASLVDRLLASPHYGERWGRHWLDVARYTESQGFEYDRLRDKAWHYRDYVIKSFNDDKPYNRFMQEQVAGDVIEPVTSEGIVATSLLVCGPWDQAGNAQSNATQRAITRDDELEDMLGVVGQSFLGLTVNCARCHAHKYDPIPHTDYYRMKSVFEGVKHGERSIAPAGEVKANKEKRAALEKEIAAAGERITRIEAAGVEITALTPEQRAERDNAMAEKEQSQAALAALKPVPSGTSYVGTRVNPPPTRRLIRGEVTSPDEVVTPGGLSAIADLNPDFGLPANSPEAERRKKFAAWLTDPKNPLPARVMANRVWHLHFGQGIVSTPNDFGIAGAKPTHPELLDWLASRFIESGWSIKSLHRLIVNSATYRQASAPNAAAAAIDAGNSLLWRYAPRRLEAEAVRDAMLAASGQLNPQMGGPSFRPFTTTDFNATFYTPADRTEPEFSRRTVYRMNVNSGKDPLLDSFDCPDPSVKTPSRSVTTTPLQALGLMNNSFVQRQANHLAERAMKAAGNESGAAINIVYRLALGRTPKAEETARAVAAAKERGLKSVCWALLNSSEFVYLR